MKTILCSTTSWCGNIEKYNNSLIDHSFDYEILVHAEDSSNDDDNLLIVNPTVLNPSHLFSCTFNCQKWWHDLMQGLEKYFIKIIQFLLFLILVLLNRDIVFFSYLRCTIQYYFWIRCTDLARSNIPSDISN